MVPQLEYHLACLTDNQKTSLMAVAKRGRLVHAMVHRTAPHLAHRTENEMEQALGTLSDYPPYSTNLNLGGGR